MKITHLILGTVLSITYASAQAITLNLPNTLDPLCSSAENCSISHYSSSPLMQVYLVEDLNNNNNNFFLSFLEKDYWLIQYNSKTGSVKNGFIGGRKGSPFYTEFINEPVSGDIWVLAPTIVDQFSDNNFVGIFTENEDFFYLTISEDGRAVDYFTCIECNYSIEFNLIGINYLSDFTSEINEDDKRTLLLHLTDSLEDFLTPESDLESDFNIETKLFVQVIPLPSAVWLFGSGIVGCFFRFYKKCS